MRVAAGPAEFTSALDNDPLLRMYCAPPRDRGTHAVSVADLAAPACADVLNAAAAGRTADPLWHLAEYVVRPLVTVFRVALDRYGLVVDTDPGRIAVEISPERRATGRVVVTAVHGAGRADVDRAAHGVARCLDLFATAFARVRLAGRVYGLGETRVSVRRIAGEELRFLRPETAGLLRGDHPLAAYVHCVSAQQDRTLRRVLDRVEERARARRADPARPRPAVMLDLDFVVLDPRERVLRATRRISGARPGAPHGIPELARPELLPVLPADHPSSWGRFLGTCGLRAAYPDVDFAALFDEFRRVFYRPWTHLAEDRLTGGAVRFIRDVRDRGGEVLFGTGRRERVRVQTEAALARGGLLGPRLLMMPDDRVRPVAELKAEQAGAVRDLEIVAVFDDLAENRAALAGVLPDAVTVAVAPRGIAADQEPPGEEADLVETFDRPPRPPGPPYACALSHAHSLAELHVGELRTRPVATGHAVHLPAAASLALVVRLVRRARAAGEETAARARRSSEASSADHSAHERTVRLIHHVLTRKQFRRGRRDAYPLSTAARDMMPCIARGEPVHLVLPAFPVKQAESGLKASGFLPDLAELALLVRLRELHAAVSAVYPPGLRITLIADGRHFRPRPPDVVNAYLRRMRGYIRLVDDAGFLRLRDIDDVAARRLGTAAMRARPELIAAHRRALRDAFRGLDITADPIGTLDRSRGMDPAGPHAPGPSVADMFLSLVHSVPIPLPEGADQREWSKALYADLYNAGDAVAPELASGRRDVLRTAWDAALRYVSVSRTDHDQGYDRMLSPRVRLTLSMPVPGRCGFAGLGGSAVMPWQGTAAVDEKGQVSTDFAIALLDQAFVPVLSPLGGDDQPWFMAPITVTQGPDRTGGTRLASGFAERIRLRRR